MQITTEEIRRLIDRIMPRMPTARTVQPSQEPAGQEDSAARVPVQIKNFPFID